MKTFTISHSLVVLIMAFAIATATLSQNLPFDEANTDTTTGQEVPVSSSHAGRFLSSRNDKYRVVGAMMTCDRYPKVCRLKGSPGRECCRKRCVDVRSDRSNCGKCGKKCGYSEICCKGKCVNPMFDKKHCGVCFNKCKKRSSCSYGMCSYA
ncbi:PREDICTED: stigma-specific STIG1-like protein 1 [Tarenaya hassleriana]|uniref:stigma-specific STIG1-like protein 1 n=1 Tax=Tarenaya hassleriana TaxID=28532 RepID=UPI00053C8C73|nr:PREDICTED: stigma-specific STIG1-like protein 1 [Tarenaya hassleriana]